MKFDNLINMFYLKLHDLQLQMHKNSAIRKKVQIDQLQQSFYLRHLLWQHISQDVNRVGFGFGGWSCSQQQLQEGNLSQAKTNY